MKNMNKKFNNINQTIWNLVRKDAAIQKDLQRKIINMRALAKHLIDKNQLSASLDAVISAIRRFQTREEFREEEKKLLNVFKGSVVSTKNNMTSLTIALTPRELFEKLCVVKGSGFNYKIATGDQEAKLMIDTPSLNDFKKNFPKEAIVKEEKELSEINVKVSSIALNTKGVLAKMAGEIALANINIKEIIICPPSFYIYIKQQDIVKAHESILKLSI
ncbi:hypothetical protein HY837_00450 [archaeon]|nr:hypothetical protein [archaeon]